MITFDEKSEAECKLNCEMIMMGSTIEGYVVTIEPFIFYSQLTTKYSCVTPSIIRYPKHDD